ncbi:hypothetical protein TraAM80_03554 [Trypanosoma rangeli]|uniref:rRNA biogenesis protein RRP36 n=1 Tax=Trypanosoma rangeli TaxID=5698 RepID=A0A422NNW0_TRYRA|nr:uncharacterized protein TraAM80_03554 [Trypanosoma rangeli]RNF07182.1 hypothetical protein TraAM80_03554 [Trypanosoma rangeli]|eukprot:RNF07182.1 hypothetical protein TraAM80_03554 [Trypanosoma rangeli]
MDDDVSDGPPPERSARVRPTHRSTLPALTRHKAVDPRFSDLYGTVDQKQFESHYKFLREQQEEEETRRRHRMRCLKCIVRRGELEASGANLEEYDLSENEREVFGEDHLDELLAMKLRPLPDLQMELQGLQRESQRHVSRMKGRQVQSRRDNLRKEIIKREAVAVKEGKKQRPFIPKRAQLKREILADTFERLERKGGKRAVDKYVERKSRR